MFSKKIIKKIPIIKRLYPSLMRRFYNNEIIRFKFFDIKLEGNINEPMDKEMFIFNSYENFQIEFLIKNIKKYNSDYFIDIGSNSGIYSLIVRSKFQKIKIKSFEPVNKTIIKFRKNLKLNKKLKNIKIYKFGLSNKNSQLLMRAKIRDGYIQSSGYGVVKKEDNLKIFSGILVWNQWSKDWIVQNIGVNNVEVTGSIRTSLYNHIEVTEKTEVIGILGRFEFINVFDERHNFKLLTKKHIIIYIIQEILQSLLSD